MNGPGKPAPEGPSTSRTHGREDLGAGGLEDSDARLAATTGLDRSLAVEASAGTGKTSLIVGRVMKLLETGTAEIQELAVITFTEKAASELEDRVRRGIEERLADRLRPGAPADEAVSARLRRAREGLDQASIQTIHSFAMSLLRRRPVEAGVDPRFTVADAAGQRFVFEETWERYVAEQAAGPNEPLERVLAAGATLRFLRDLAKKFVENRDVSASGAPSRVPAPDAAEHARRIAEWTEAELRPLLALCRDPGDKLCQALSEAAARGRRVGSLTPERAHRALLQDPPKIPGNVGRAQAWPGTTKSRVQELAEPWKERFGAYRQAFERHVTGEAAFWLQGFLAAYEDRKRRDGLLDFQDLLLLARRLLRNPRIAEECRRAIRFVLVDEFQDTDPLQVEIAALLTGEGTGEEWTSRTPIPGALFFVGDPKQSIYRFRRADLATYERARAWLDASARGVGSATLAITANFRSRPGITSFVNATFAPLFTGLDVSPRYSRLDPQRSAGSGEAVAYLVPDAPMPAPAPGARRDAREARIFEASMIARAIRRGVEDRRWRVAISGGDGEREADYGDVALLFRSFSDVGLYEEALQDEGIAFQTAVGRRYFLRPEVAWLASLLRAVESPHDEVAVTAALRSPFFGLSDEAILVARHAAGRLDPLRPDAAGGDAARALAQLARWHAGRNVEPAGVFVRRILDESSALALLALREDGERSLVNLLKIADLARRHESDGGTFRSFVRWLKRARVEEFEQPETAFLEATRGAVQILTIHAAKGLEFPIVVLPDLARTVSVKETFLIDRDSGKIAFRLMGSKDASFRSQDYETMLAVEEPILAAERQRLLYVAATRAKDLLVVPISRPGGKPEQEAFIGDLAKGGALPDEAALASVPADRTDASVVLPNGARVRLERVAMSPRPGAGRTPVLPEKEPRETVGGLGSWLRERKALLARASRSPRFLAASGRMESQGESDDGLASEAASRAAFDLDLPGIALSRWGTEGERTEEARARIEEARDAARKSARRFGLAVHAVLEAADFDDPAGIATLAEWQASVQRLPGEARRIEDAARRALDMPAVAGRRGRRVQREVYVAFVEDDVLVEGQIDLLIEQEDGSFLVADFKTDPVADRAEAEARAVAYASQLALYARALERATGRRVRETALLFVTAGIEVRLPNDDAAADLAREAIKRAMAGERIV